MSSQDLFGIVAMFYAVPVPVIVWFFLAKYFATRADSIIDGVES